MAGLAVLALHWWNPLAHRAHRAFRIDQELACDETVLARADAADRHAYGCAVVKSAATHAPAAACALNNTTQLKRRLKMMARHTDRGARAVAGRVAVALLAGGGLVATASGAAALTVAQTTEVVTSIEAASAAPAVPAVAAVSGAPGAPAAPAVPPLLAVPPVPPVPPVPSIDGEAIAAQAEEAARQGVAAAHSAERMVAGMDIGAIVASSLASARASGAAACAGQGPDCLRLVDTETLNALRETRAELAAEAAAEREPIAVHAIQAAAAAIDAQIVALEQRAR